MRSKLAILLLPLFLGACTFEDATDNETPEPAETAPAQTGAVDISVPDTGVSEYDEAALAQARLDPAWRSYAERDRQARAQGLRGTAPAASPGAEPLTDDVEAESDSATAASTEAMPVPPSSNDQTSESSASGSGSGSGTSSPEAFEQISQASLRQAPTLPVPQDGGGPSALRTQILLDRARFSPGILDGYWGKNTEKAIYWFQHANDLPTSGKVDKATWDALVQAAGGESEPLTQVTVTQEDLQGPFVNIPDDMYEKAKLDCLCYRSPLEKIAEHNHASPELLKQLNPQADLQNLQAGAKLWVPKVPNLIPEDLSVLADNGEPGKAGEKEGQKEGRAASPAEPGERQARAGADQDETGRGGQEAGRGAAGGEDPSSRVARIVVAKKGFYLHALDEQGNIVYHFPSTLGSKYDPTASGDYKITGLHPEPDFHYQPKLFSDVPDTDPDAYLPAGPNSPVGLIWMQLSKPHLGIHGTAFPETIGYTSSHGCVRLTNWDAVFLAQNIDPGVPVEFRE